MSKVSPTRRERLLDAHEQVDKRRASIEEKIRHCEYSPATADLVEYAYQARLMLFELPWEICHGREMFGSYDLVDKVRFGVCLSIKEHWIANKVSLYLADVMGEAMRLWLTKGYVGDMLSTKPWHTGVMKKGLPFALHSACLSLSATGQISIGPAFPRPPSCQELISVAKEHREDVFKWVGSQVEEAFSEVYENESNKVAEANEAHADPTLVEENGLLQKGLRRVQGWGLLPTRKTQR